MTSARPLLLASLVFASTVSAAEEQGRMTVKASCVSSAECQVAGTLTLRAASDPSITIVQSIARGAATVTLDDRATEWELELAADGFWMPRQLVKTTTAELTIPTWRTTRLTGRFTPPPKARLPKSFELTAQSPLGTPKPAIAEGTVIECPLAADGTWDCAVPAVRLDLILRVRGFTPHYAWDIRMQPGAPKSIAPVALRRGASLVAWLDRETVNQLKKPARARLMRVAMLVPSPVAQELSKPVAEADFSERGMVQLAPIPPGTYSLEVSSPEAGTAKVTQIEVYEGKESTLRHPIRLEPPLAIRVTVKPPRDPHGKPWQVMLSRIAELTGQHAYVERATTGETGLWTVEGQTPGKYYLTVRDSQDSQYARRTFTIQTEADAFVIVDVAALRVKGRVTIGDRPIAADLLFGEHGGAERVKAKSNEEGELEVILPRAGVWRVVVQQDAGGIRSRQHVTVEPDEPIEIELPDTEIAGWVVGTDGKRTAAARVGIFIDTGMVEQPVDPDGAFRIRGLPAGTIKINAHGQRGERSRVVEIAVQEDTRTEGVQLELEGSRKIRGTLFSQGQPVTGAKVVGYGVSGRMFPVSQTVSGFEGEFELSFQTSVTSIWLIVASPGRTLQAYTVSPADDAIRLELAPVGGVVRLARPATAKRPILIYNGTDIPMNDLAQWAQAHGKPFAGSEYEIPALAPGPYRFCADTGGGTTCREGLLARGGSLRLAIE